MISFLLTIMAHAQERSYQCPELFGLIGKRCIKATRLEPVFACSAGINQGGVCVDSTAPTLKCEYGSTRNGDVCEVSKYTPMVKKIAPAGYTDNGTGYSMQMPLKVISACSAGEMVEDNCVIEKVVPGEPKRYCAGGATLDSKGCASFVQLETMPVCEVGNYIDGTCVRYAETPALDITGSCPEGTEKQGEKCVAEVPGAAVLRCQDGSEPDMYGMCQKTRMLKMSPKPMCPASYYRHATECRQDVEGTVSESCPAGSMNNGDMCVREEQAAAIETAECPEGFVAHAGKDLCYKTEIYDCSPNQSGKTADQLRGTSVRTVTQECERKETAEKTVTYDCPEGFELGMGNLCVKDVQVKMIEKCSLPGKSAADCKGFITSPIVPTISCPEGSDLKDNMCVQQEQVEPEEYCEATGNKMGEDCKVAVESSLLTGKSCGPGFELGKSGEICFKMTKTAPTMVCENQNLPVDDCILRSYTAPVERMVCPDGAIQKGDDCYKQTVIAPTLMCEDGKSVAECKKESMLPYEYQCPHFASLKGSKCYEVTRKALIEECEEGGLVNGMCLKTYPSSLTCPERTRLVGDYCYGKEFAQPIVTYTTTCVGKNCDQ